MNNGKGEDPVFPQVTFDNYLVQEVSPQVEEPQKPKPWLIANGFMVSIGVVWVLTFALGVLATLSFVGSDSSEAQASVVAETDAMALVPELPQQDSNAVADPAPMPVPTALAQLVEASLNDLVTRTQNADLLGTAGPMSRIEPEGPTYADILHGLTLRGTPVETTQEKAAKITQEKLRLIREGVLGGTYTVKAIKRKGRERLCLRFKNADVSRKEVEMILQNAIAQGEFEVPEALRQEGGAPDVDTLLFSFVQTSLANDGTEEGARAAQEMSRRAFAASTAKTSKAKEGRVYVVEPGDSLAYISLQFYGRPSDYEKIFQANRELLSSPDLIRVGQRLIIPG